MIGALSNEMKASNLHLIEMCGRIEAKADHTNGRVRKLEQWKYAMFGGMVLANLLIVPIIVEWMKGVLAK